MYLSGRRPSHTHALLEVEESQEDDMRQLWLRMDKEGVRKDVASHTRQTTCVPTWRTSRAPEPQQTPRAHPPPQPCSPPRLPTFPSTVELTKLRAETLAKHGPWYDSAARGPSVQNIDRLDTRLMTASSSRPHVPALTA